MDFSICLSTLEKFVNTFTVLCFGENFSTKSVQIFHEYRIFIYGGKFVGVDWGGGVKKSKTEVFTNPPKSKFELSSWGGNVDFVVVAIFHKRKFTFNQNFLDTSTVSPFGIFPGHVKHL